MKYNDIFLKVNKPARYTGGEFNSCDYNKPHDLAFCMCFPEPYEVAMSNLGIKILYHMLNGRADTVCERCFFPWEDFTKELTANNIPLFSIESKKSLKDFDILGFSIHHELCYTNVLHMLKLAGLPFYSKDRGEEYPLVIAGGPCSINPEPYAEFFDLIIIGEGEESLNSLCSLYLNNKKLNKTEFLKKAAEITGVYVPSMVKVSYNEDNTIKNINCDYPVKKAFVRDLDSMFYPCCIIVPNIEVVHDRGVLELYRGCSNGCRFCQAGFISRPIRHKSIETLYNQAEKMIKSTGFEEMSLSSLSTGDYPRLTELLKMLEPLKKSKNMSFSLPSLRLSGYLKEFAENAGSVTFAPEAGTERLRKVINKNITDDDINNGFKEAFSQGCTNLKLYFMCGLPTETTEDIEGIAEIAFRAKKIFKEFKTKKSLNINVSCAVLIPKPFTPFQWEAMEGRESILNKQQQLKKLLGVGGIKFSYHGYEASRLEGVFARGDRRLNKVLVIAYESGCLLDGWSEYLKFGLWEKAFESCGIDMEFYTKEHNINEILPWDFIDINVSKKYIENERSKAYNGTVTNDCRIKCNICGANTGGGCQLC